MDEEFLDWDGRDWGGGLALHFRCLGMALSLHFGRRIGLPKTTASPPPASPFDNTHDGRLHDPELEGLAAAVRGRGLGEALAAAGEPNPVDGPFLGAWLEAGGGRQEDALAALQAHASWRREVTEGQGHVQAAQIPRQLAANKTFLQASDASGRPLVLVLGRRHFGGDLPQFTRLLVFAIDAALARVDESVNPERRIRAVLDLKGIGLRNLDAATITELFRVIGRHYPGNLDTFWFLDAPLIFNGLWRAVKQLLPAIVTPRVAFIKRAKDGTCPILMEAFGPEALPKVLGGTAELVPVEEAVQAGPAAVAARMQAQDVGIGLGHDLHGHEHGRGPPLGMTMLPYKRSAGEVSTSGVELSLEVVVCLLAVCLMYMLISNSREARLQQWMGNAATNSVESKYYAALSVLTAQALKQAQSMMSSVHR